MKVKCNLVGTMRNLTYGKEYEVIEEEEGRYKIIDDSGHEERYYKNRFEIVKEEPELSKGCLSTCEQAKFCEDDASRIIDCYLKKEETVTTGQMIDILLKNPKRKAKCIEDDNFEEHTMIVNMFPEDEHFEYIAEDGMYYDWIPRLDYKNSRWQIIEPEKVLKKMNFAEAFKYYKKNKVLISNINRKYDYPICSDYLNLNFASDEEIEGDWTVEDIYEDTI